MQGVFARLPMHQLTQGHVADFGFPRDLSVKMPEFQLMTHISQLIGYLCPEVPGRIDFRNPGHGADTNVSCSLIFPQSGVTEERFHSLSSSLLKNSTVGT